ncbi:hypothetical protein GcM1_134004 [Golovinomyces cichoracearum]|uniref:Uncharacterized protein n=1 Tax=Golovinomyces cichoracearum TaxID=62708 RepID=A0A420JBP6_9PEZI|nr:hypothetical protein GcM1_134004 [Golovinomyces cichoracearum]
MSCRGQGSLFIQNGGDSNGSIAFPPLRKLISALSVGVKAKQRSLTKTVCLKHA